MAAVHLPKNPIVFAIIVIFDVFNFVVCFVDSF